MLLGKKSEKSEALAHNRHSVLIVIERGRGGRVMTRNHVTPVPEQRSNTNVHVKVGWQRMLSGPWSRQHIETSEALPKQVLL